MKRINGANLAMTRGDTESITVVKKQDGETIPFETGDTVTFTMRRKSRDNSEITYQVVVENFVDGKAIIPIPHEATADLAATKYAYDVELIDADGNYTTIIGGDQEPAFITLYQDVTW